MAAVVRLFWLLFFQALTFVSAHPSFIHAHPNLLPRAKPIVTNTSGTVQVFDPSTQSIIEQAAATDGGGTNFDAPALIWIGFSLLIGVPMACAGIRGWRFTTGAGVGLAAVVCAWAALNNTISAPGLSDILLTLILMGFFGLGFAVGVFEFARLGAIAFIGLSGGTAFGIRVVLAKAGLLVAAENLYPVNLAIVAAFAAVNGLTLIWAQRAGLVFACASIGTFLTALGLDLIMSRQAGISRGLRFLFDRNDSHFADILTNGYSPSILTRIIIYASLGLTPILAYTQHKIFKQPFTRRRPQSDSELAINFPTVENAEDKRTTFFGTLLNSNTKSTSPSPSRFSM